MTLRAVVRGVGHYLPARIVENSEFEATLDGVAYEIEVSAETGMVLEIELDDDGDDADDS